MGKIDTIHFATLNQRAQAFSAQLASGVVKIDHLVEGLSTVQSLVDREATKMRLEIVTESQKTRDGVAAKSQETQGRIATESQMTREHVATESQKTRNGIALESQKTGQCVLDRIKKVQTDNVEQEQRERLLGSLMFPEMNARYNAIVPSHESTFEWIYARGLRDHPGDDDLTEVPFGTLKMHDYSNTFTKWLRSEESLFWIRGKPGSGKSTLMKFLVEHSRTLNILRQHDPSALVISSFIWNAGSAHQRRQTCVLSSILHQLLSQRHDVTRKLLGEEKRLHHKRQFSDWSQATIESTLFKTIQMSHCTICIFLDGLDEIDQKDGDGLYEFLQQIHRLRALPNIKLCVSSRPEAPIAKQLNRFPGFRLQDLNEHDIKTYAWDTLNPVWKESSSLYRKEDGLSSLVSLILEKADGVFLWVRLVVSSIRNGLIKYDDWDMLLRRVDILPGKLGDLYNDMWQRLNVDMEVHRAKSALYFKLLLYRTWDSPQINNLPLMLLASEIPLRQLLLQGGATVPENAFAKQCTIFQHQFLSRCAGFVELVVHAPYRNTSPLELWKPQFIHKSAVDFLVDTSDGHQILQHDQTILIEIFVSIHTSTWIYRFLRPHTNYSVSTRTHDIYNAVYAYIVGSKIWGAAIARVESPLLNLMRATLERVPEFRIYGLDFLAVTSELGLCDYVKKCIQEEPPPKDLSLPDWKSTILAHASMGYENSIDKSTVSGLELVMWLLQEGADLNFRISSVRLNGQTPFHCFLLAVLNRLYWPRSYSEANKILNMSMRAFQQFLDHGADTNIALLLLADSSPSDYRRFPRFKESIRHESVGTRILGDDTGLNSFLEEGDFMNSSMTVFVDVEMGSAMVYRTLRERLEDDAEARKESYQEHPKISLVPVNAVHFHVKLITRQLAGTARYTTKVITSDTDFQHLMPKPEQVFRTYLASEGLEMDEQETLGWLVENGYLSTALLRIPFDKSLLFNGHYSFPQSPETLRTSIVDFTFKPAYSDLRQALSRLPQKDDNVSDFISQYNKYEKMP